MALPANVTTGTWTLDPSHSEIGFTVRHAGISKVRGQFTDAAATLDLAENVTDSKVNASIKTASFDSGDANRDGHVRGEDFFDVETFLLPKPSDIAQAFWDDKGTLWDYGLYTFKEAAGGFALGSSFGILMALFLARFRALGSALLPFAIAANAIPIIAFAPITNTWFSMARARRSTSQWASPVTRVKFAGTVTIRAPRSARIRYSSGKRRS